VAEQPACVNNNPDDTQPNAITGCTTLFLFYLHDYLGYSINEIIRSGGDTIADVYRKLTRGNAPFDPFPDFLALINAYYPPTRLYTPATESLFPLSNLNGFTGLGALRSGYDNTGIVSIDRPALADIPIALTSDDPLLVSVPAEVIIKQGKTSASVQASSQLIPMPFKGRRTTLRASYGGKTIATDVEVEPPSVGVTLASPYLIDGDAVEATIELSYASKLGDVVVAVSSSSTGFAQVPATVTVEQ
jgi:hypothetical protein